jgi:uncharacterized protein DUF1353
VTPFLTPLVLQPLPERRWQVAADFRVQTTVPDMPSVIVVPAGFVCDLNSIPRALWWESTPADYPEAGVTHDYLYAIQAPRASADAVYAELLGALGCPRPQIIARYWAIRLFGGPAYRRHDH